MSPASRTVRPPYVDAAAIVTGWPAYVLARLLPRDRVAERLAAAGVGDRRREEVLAALDAIEQAGATWHADVDARADTTATDVGNAELPEAPEHAPSTRMTETVPTSVAARTLRVSDRRVRQMIDLGELPARREGRHGASTPPRSPTSPRPGRRPPDMSPTPADIAEQRAAQLPDAERRTFDAFKRLGMSAPAALEATRGRDEPALPSTPGQAGSRPVAPHELAREALDGDLTGRSQAIAARRDAREAAERGEQRATSGAWQLDRTERAARHVAEVVDARQAQEARLGLRAAPAATGSATGQLREAAADKREQLVAVSEQRYLREGCSPEQARQKAERLWPAATVLIEEADSRLSEAATRRLRELLVDGKRIRDAVDQLEQEGLA